MSIRNWAAGALVALITNINLCYAESVSATKYNFSTSNARVTIEQAASLNADQQKDLVCTSLNIYHEARGTTYNNKVGVAWVVKNRMQIKQQTACEVVYTRNGTRGRAQFSWTTHRHIRALDKNCWDDAQKIAYMVLFDSAARDITRGSTHFHEKHVNPVWSSKTKNKVVLGAHVFVRVESYLQSVEVP